MRKRAWKKGTAVITAVALVLTGIALPHDTAAAAKMKLNKKKVTLKVGKKVKLKLKNAKKKVSWKSSNKKIASVTKKGIVKGKKPGKTKITAKCQGKKFICKVTVKRQGGNDASMDITSGMTPVPGITVSPVAPTVKPTGKPLTPTKTPAASAGGKTTASPGVTETGKPDAQETADPADTPAASATDTPDITDPTGTPGASDPDKTPGVDEPDKTPGVDDPDATPGVNDPDATPKADPSATPGINNPDETPGVDDPDKTPAPTASQDPSGDDDDDYGSSEEKPETAPADTLAVGRFQIRLGMTKDEVAEVMGDEPDYTGTSPQGMETCMYNPSGDYFNLIEVQFQDEKVAELSTISAYFCYAGIVSSGDTADSLKADGFSSMSAKFNYEAGYQYSNSTAYITAFVDHQGDGGVYGVQIFDKTLASKLDNLILPQNCTYNEKVAASMSEQMAEYVNAFRVFKGLDDMYVNENSDRAALTHAAEIASTGKTTDRSADGTSWSERFKENYFDGDDYLAATEFVADSCVDAFSYVVYAVDTTKNAEKGGVSPIYKYMTMEEIYSSKDDETYTVDPEVACGFAYNSETKLITFGVIDIYSW